MSTDIQRPSHPYNCWSLSYRITINLMSEIHSARDKVCKVAILEQRHLLLSLFCASVCDKKHREKNKYTFRLLKNHPLYYHIYSVFLGCSSSCSCVPVRVQCRQASLKWISGTWRYTEFMSAAFVSFIVCLFIVCYSFKSVAQQAYYKLKSKRKNLHIPSNVKMKRENRVVFITRIKRETEKKPPMKSSMRFFLRTILLAWRFDIIMRTALSIVLPLFHHIIIIISRR